MNLAKFTIFVASVELWPWYDLGSRGQLKCSTCKIWGNAYLTYYYPSLVKIMAIREVISVSVSLPPKSRQIIYIRLCATNRLPYYLLMIYRKMTIENNYMMPIAQIRHVNSHNSTIILKW